MEAESGDIRARLVSVEKDQAATTQRVIALEAAQMAANIAEARKEGAWTNMKDKLDALTVSITEIQGTLRWIGRLVIGGIIAGVVAFIFKGGFAIPPL
jgi:hypothetical protein